MAKPADNLRTLRDDAVEPTRPRVLVLIPAHDEETQIATTIESVLAQTRPADRIVVIDDASTDRTAQIARAKGVDVFPTVSNRARKAGALNQGYERFAAGFDYVLQMDADTILREDFLESALEELEADPRLAAVCGRFFAKPGRGIVHRLQRIEYARYDQNRHLKGGRVCVLSGTSTVFRVRALPERPWSETSLVEDYALTLALKRAGWNVKAGAKTFAYTETMPTLRTLWRQRVRWARGTLDELRAEGWKPYTREDVGLHVLAAAMILLRLLWIAAITATLAVGAPLTYPAIWIALTAVMVAEGVLSVRKLGWRDKLLVLLVVPEELYQLFRQMYLVRAAWASFRKAAHAW